MGLKVAVADERKVGMSQWSNKSYFAGIYSSPLTQSERFISDVSRMLEKTGATFLFPSHDETEVLAKYREDLPANIILPVATYESILKANDKAKMASIANGVDVPVPQIIKWQNIEELKQQLEKSEQTNFVVKLRRGNSSKGVFYPKSKQAVIKKTNTLIKQYQLSKDRYPIIQDKIDGDGWGVSCLYWEGERITSFTHKRLKEKIKTGGTSTLRISEHNHVLEEYAFAILDKMNWHGLAMVEFKYNENSKQGWFIEVNPRLWGSLHLAVSSGVDFPKLLYLAATKGVSAAKEEVLPQKEGIIARWYMGDIIMSVSSLLDLKPINAIKSLLPGHCDTYDDINRDDLGAFAGEFAGYLSTFLSSRSLNPEKEGMLG
jgi:predicted ATP-grasp superfamily ATP-dependent carboligase